MTETHPRIAASLDRLGRRRVRLLAGEAVARAATALALAVAAGIALVGLGQVPAGGGPWLVGLIGFAGVVALLWDARSWRGAADRRAQAQRVERVVPELRGALLTVLDRSVRPMGSPALLGLLAAQVEAPVLALPPSRAWSSERLRRLGWRTSAALLVVVGAYTVGDGPGFLALLRARPVTAAPAASPVPPVATETLGDITLRYLYPTYTRLDPLEVPNSNGEVHAPPGTVVEIRARTADTHESASLVAYEAPTAATIEGRQVSGSLTVAGPGTWRFQFGELRSADMKILPDPDLAPDVSLQASTSRLTLGSDDEIGVPYSARDDYGVTRVVVEVKSAGGTREVELRTPADVPRALNDQVRLSTKLLGLKTGEKATIRVGAWDNDAIGGSKVGWSSAVTVEAAGPRGVDQRTWAFRRAARDALVLVLADFLVDPVPAADTGRAANAWAVEADERYGAYDELVRQTWTGAVPSKIEKLWMEGLSKDRRSLIAFARGLNATDDALSTHDAATLDDLHAKNVATVEHAVLLLDQLLQARQLSELYDETKDLATLSKQLSKDLDSLNAAQAAARLDALRRAFDQLSDTAKGLDDGDLREFIEDRQAETKALMDLTRRLYASGKDADARAAMKRVGEQVDELVDGIQQIQERGTQKGGQLQKQMQSLQQELQKLDEDQQALRQETEKARQKYGSSMTDAQAAWEQVERLSTEIADTLGDDDFGAVRRVEEGLDAAFGDAETTAVGLRNSARARDLESAQERVGTLGYELDRGEMRARALRRVGGDGADTIDRIADPLATVQDKATKVQELLDKMQSSQSDVSPDLQKALRNLAEQQQALANRARTAEEHAGKVAQQLPMQAPGLEEGAQQAAQQADRAAGAMRGGDPMRSTGAQRSTEDGLEAALEALQQAQDAMAQLSRARSGERPEGGKPGDDEGENTKPGDGAIPEETDVALPAPEEFKSPEEYRKALLEGMTAEVPEAYQANKQRYYEELVRQ